VYSKTVPFKDLNGKPRNEVVHFNLFEREVFKLLVEFQNIFKWQESIKGETREVETREVVEFYDNFERILLEAWGEPSSDGLHFRKGGRYDFEESALFNACMVLFVSDPGETSKLIDELMPKDMQELVKTAEVNLAALENAPETTEELKAELARLRAKTSLPQAPSSDTE
jgi:hypothetical protein